MIKRNKILTCFFLVMLITLMSCCIVAATDNADYNTTTTTNTIEVNKNVQNNNNAYTISETQSDDNTIEETDDQNAVKQENKTAKAKTINKVNNTQTVKTANTISNWNGLSSSTSGENIITSDLNVTSKIDITINNDTTYVLDGQGHVIRGKGDNSPEFWLNYIVKNGGNVTIKNVVFENFNAAVISFAPFDTSLYTSSNIYLTVDNCTFRNGWCNKNNRGIIYPYLAGSNHDRNFLHVSVSNCKFEDIIDSPLPQYRTHLIYSGGSCTYVTLTNNLFHGVELRESDMSTAHTSRIDTAFMSKYLVCGLDVIDSVMNINTTFDFNLFTYMYDKDNGPLHEGRSGNIHYNITDEAGNVIVPTTFCTTNSNGRGNVTHNFTKKGKYIIDYSFLESGLYEPVFASKEFVVNETSIISDIDIISIVKDEKIEVQAILKNSTGSAIGNAPLNITFHGHSYQGFTDANGLVIFNIPYSEYGAVYDAVISYAGDTEHFIGPTEEEYRLDLSKPLSLPVNLTAITPLEGYTGETVTLTAIVKELEGSNIDNGNVTFSVNGNPVNANPIPVNNGLATCTYTITTNDSVVVLVNYTGVEGEYKSNTTNIVVNRLTIGTNLTIVNVPDSIKVGEEFNFDVKLTNRTGEGVVGKTVKVMINGVEVENLGTTNASGMINVHYTPKNNSELRINASFNTDGSDVIYASNTTSAPTIIESSSISLIDAELGLNYSGNASIGHDYLIKVNLTDGDEALEVTNITVKNGVNAIDPGCLSISDDNKLLTITLRPTTVTEYDLTINYPGLQGVYNEDTESVHVSVNKIRTSTFVDYSEYDDKNITLMIHFEDEFNEKITHDAVFQVKVNGSESERYIIDMNNLDNNDIRYNVTESNGIFYVHIDPVFYKDTGNETYAFITFNGNDMYERSTGSVGGMDVKTDINIRLNTYEDALNTTRKSVFHINETVNIYLDLINHFGFMQNGEFNISIANNNNPENARNLTNQVSNNTHGWHLAYENRTSGEYTITVYYRGSAAYNPTSITKTFTLLKLESSTTARVINNTAGNITIAVKVKNNLDDAIKKGNLTVEVNGVPKVVPFDMQGDEIIVNLNSIGLGISTTSDVPITITYQGSSEYTSSQAVDEATGNILSVIKADKGVTNISVALNPEDNVVIDTMFDVYGYLKELDGTPISSGNINITIINPEGTVISSENVTTSNNGYYTNTYTAQLTEYPAGEYTINVSYYDNDHNITTVQKTLTVTRVTTNVTATVTNTTAGNITVKVKVTDKRGNPITEGKVNITDASGEILYNDVDVDTNGEATLIINSIKSKGTNSFVVNYNGTDKYQNATTTNGLTDIEVTMRDLTINATPINSTYGNVSFKVNLTDTTTGEGLENKEFKILDANNNPLGSGTYTTGSDGTVIIDDIEFSGIGDKTIYINYTDSVNYTTKKVPVTLSVEPRESNVNAKLINTTAGNVTVQVNATDKTTGNPITSGTIIITDNGEEVAHYTFNDITSGIVDVPTDILESGNHNLIVTLHSNNYRDSSYTDNKLGNTIVNKRNTTVTFAPVNSTIGNTTVKVTVSDENGTKIVNGTVNVYSDEERTNLIGTATTNEDGDAIINVTTTATTNTIYIEYTGNTTYEANITTQHLTLQKRETSVNASLVNSTAGSVTVRVNVTDVATGENVNEGTIIIKDGDKVVATYPITENPGFIDVKTNITESGDHSLTVEYVGTDTYDDSIFTDTQGALKDIVVDRRNATVIYEVVNSTYNDTVIKVTLVDEDGVTPVSGGSVNVYLPGESQALGTNVTDSTGVTYISVKVPVTATELVVNYTGNTTYNENVTTQEITITPRAVNVNATIINKTAGNITVKVNVTDVDTGLNVTHGIINITSNGKVVASVNLTEIDENIATVNPDGTLTIYTNIEEALRYTLSVNYYGSPYYDDEVFQTESFTATYKESNLTADIPNKTKGNTTLYVNLTDLVTGEDITGVVYVSVDGAKKVEYPLNEGKLEELLDLPLGPHTVTVTYNGDNKYNESTATVEIIVLPREISVGYEITNHTLGNVTINVTVNDTETKEGINGRVIVHVGDVEVPVTVVDGVGIAVLDIPITGGEVSVSYPADDTYQEVPKSTPEHVTVEQRQSSVKAEVVDNTTGQVTLLVNVTDTTTGNAVTNGRIIITDGENVVYNDTYTSADGVVDVKTNITTSGTHKLNVTFTGNENYTDANYTDNKLGNIAIENRTANITVTPNNSTFGNTTIDVTVVDSETGQPLPPGGKVEVFDSEGNPVGEGTIGEDGKVTIPITVPVNTTNVTVKYLGNDTSYNPAEVNYTGIKLDKRASNVVAEVTNTTAGNITVKVNVTDATNGTGITEGTVDITLNGEVVGTADLSKDLLPDGTVVIYTNITNVGNYALVAKYSGNENYTGANVNMEAFDAKTKESNLTASVPNTTKGNTTLEVMLKDPVTGEKLNGTVYVIINGQESGRAYPVKDGVLNTNGLLDLPVGKNTVKVVFDGDKTYNATEVEFNVTVEPRAINVNATLTNNTVGNITLEVNVTDNETGVGVNGTVEVTLPNGTIVPVEVVNGTAVVVLDIPIDDTTGEPIQVRYPADGVNTETIVNTTNNLNIEKRASNVDATTGNVTAGNTTIDVKVTDPVTGEPVTEGEVIITLNGEPIGRQPVGPDGTVTVPVELPNKGNYTLDVTYKGGDNYADDDTSIDNVEVLGRESEVKVDVLNSTRGNTTLNITIKDSTTGEPLNGTVNVTLPDGTTIPVEIINGSIVKELDIPYPGGDVTVTLPEDGSHNSSNITIPVPVDKRSTSLDINITNATAGNTTVKVNVTDSETGKAVTTGEVSITVNGEEVGRLSVGPDGTVTIPTSIGSTGTYPIVATYEGNDDYDKVSKQAETVTVLPKESSLTAQLTNNTRGNTSINVTLRDPVTGTGLNGTVTVTLPDGTNMPVNVTDGKAVIPVDLPAGNNTLRVTYLGNETYDSIHIDIPVSVNKRDTTITSNITNSTTGNVTFKTNVRDTTTQKALTGGVVVAKVNGTIVGTSTLDKDGNAVITTDISKSGNYDVVLEYMGDKDYASSNITENKINVTPRASNVTVNITNSTVGDTKVNITMVDPSTDKPINGEVIVTLPDGSNITATAENGNIVLPVDLPVGDNEIIITYPGNDTYDEVVIKLPVKISKRTTNTIAKELTGTAQNVAVEVKVTDEATGEPVTSGEVIITTDGKQVGKAPVKNGVAIVDTNIAKSGNYTLDIKYAGSPQYETSNTKLKETVNPREIKVDVRVVNNTVADTAFEVKVTDAITGKPVPNETVTVTLPNGTKVSVKTDANGQATIKTGATSGKNTITVKVDGNDVYNSSTQTINTTIVKSKVTLSVDSIKGIIGEKIVLTAHLVDEFGNTVNGGNLVFKLNGRTLQTDGRFDTSTDKPMKFKVTNGVVTFTMTADLYLRAGKNITASYSGSYMYESGKGNVAEANIRKRTAEVTVTTSPRLVKQDKDVVFTAKISDITSGSSKSLVNSNNAYVIFKVNGKTIKDNKGENIKVPVVNGIAKYTYHVPRGTSGMIDGHMRDYIVTAVYSNNDFYPDARDTVVYNVERSRTTINITRATVKNDKLSIKADILDQYGKNVIGKNSISVKINGKTFKVDGKSLTYTVNNGKISLSGIKLAGNKVKSLTIITGERQSYYESQVTTKSVKTL